MKQKNQTLKNVEIPQYGKLYFDHLQGEFAMIADGMSEADKHKCLAIQTNSDDKLLTWNEIYTYELILMKYQDLERLKGKIISLRLKFQNLVGIAEYNNYASLRAVDLTKEITAHDIENLRADYNYLLDEFYLRYAYTSAQERLRTKLLRYGALMTLSFFVLAAVFTILSFKLEDTEPTFFAVSVLIIVVFAGIMGAFVSMQQRLQTVSNQGDPIYNLSLLTHGWFSIFLSPISGAIFALILYAFFASGIFEGKVFPKMKTAVEQEDILNGVGETRDKPAEKTITVSSKLSLTDFLRETSPRSGADFALLMIWSFIAGFAERFVPDTLMRLVNQKKSGETAET